MVAGLTEAGASEDEVFEISVAAAYGRAPTPRGRAPRGARGSGGD